MKQNIKFLILFFVLVASFAICPKQAMAQQSYVSFQTFYDELSPYGEWVDYPKYGYVWIPDVSSSFVPYSTDGQWVMTDYGWTWVSNFEWGWAPFHYGRWDYDNYYGWLWVPDNQWGPSWVTWVQSDGYYGWQPMQPGISISLSFGRDYRTNFDHWTFVRDRDFERSDIQRYYVNRTDQSRIIRNSSVINNTYNDRTRNTTYISGPKRDDVQRVTGTKIKSVAIQENNKPGQNLSNDRLKIYRPEVRNNSNQRKPAPSRITKLDNIKRPSERNATNPSQKVNPNDNNKRQQPVQPQQRQQQQVQPKQQAQPQQRQQQPVQPKQQAQPQQRQQQPVQPKQQAQPQQQRQQQQQQQQQQAQPKQQAQPQQRQQQQAQPQQQQQQPQRQQQEKQQPQQQRQQQPAQPQQQRQQQEKQQQEKQQQNATPPAEEKKNRER